MADVAQEFGLARVWRSVTQNAGEREAVMALAMVLPIGALILGFCRGRKSRSRGRPMTFTSGYMSVGSWPTDIKMSDPVITAFMFLDSVPQQAAVEEACSKMLRYHNFRGVPRCRRLSWLPPWFFSRFEWHDIEVRPADVITRVQANGSAEVLVEMDRVKDAPILRTTSDGRDMPMWSLHIIENTGTVEAGVGSVIALRVHHTIGDGMSLVAVAQSVLEAATGGPIGQGGGNGAGTGGALANGCKPEGRNLSNFSVGKILRGVADVIALSTSGPDTPLPFGHFEAPCSGGGSAAARVGLKKNGKRGIFSRRRRTVLFPDIPLSLVKKIKDAAGVTVNDVVMCLVAGCIRRYSEAQGAGDTIGGPGFKSRGLIPVAMPRTSSSADPADILCNKWAFVSVNLSIDEEDPAARLAKMKETTASIKGSPTPGLQFMLTDRVLPYLPWVVCREMVHGALATHTVTVSNVPGPQETIAFAGVPLRTVHFTFSNLAPQVNVLSLDGAVALNFVVDPIAVADSETLPAHFVAELGAMAEKVGVKASVEISAVTEEAATLVGLMNAAAKASPLATQS